MVDNVNVLELAEKLTVLFIVNVLLANPHVIFPAAAVTTAPLDLFTTILFWYVPAPQVAGLLPVNSRVDVPKTVNNVDPTKLPPNNIFAPFAAAPDTVVVNTKLPVQVVSVIKVAVPRFISIFV